MIGPVLYQEMLLASRRTRQYAFRWLYAGWMVLQLAGLAFILYFQSLFTPEHWDLPERSQHPLSRVHRPDAGAW